jgi:hypothetical protein
LRRPRTLFTTLMSGLVTARTLLALIPLISVVWSGCSYGVVVRKSARPCLLNCIQRLSRAVVVWQCDTRHDHHHCDRDFDQRAAGNSYGHLLSQTKGGSRLAHTVRFAAKIMTGFPSILAGVFAYGVVVLLTGGFSAIAGGVAISILMLPTIMLTAEDAIRMVPAKMKEAAIGPVSKTLAH